MNKFERQAIELRQGIVAYIEDYCRKANRNIIINKGAVTYLAWDYASPSTNEDEIELVPEVEIALIGLSPEGDVRFVDNKGNEIMPGALDTEELLYVIEFLEYLDEDAPKAEEGSEK